MSSTRPSDDSTNPYDNPHPDDYAIPTTDELEKMRASVMCTQKELAERAGLNPRTVGRIERDGMEHAKTASLVAILDAIAEKYDELSQ